jgi:hypothetical protein
VITTVVPADPEHGVNDLMVGEQAPGLVLVKSVGLFAVPLELVTWIVPLVVPATVAQISVAETILNAVTGVPPISTLDTSGFLKSLPVITITHPAGPLVGENDVMVGETATAGVSKPSMSEAAATPTPARRRPRCRFARVMLRPHIPQARSNSEPGRVPIPSPPIFSVLPGRGGVHIGRDRHSPTRPARPRGLWVLQGARLPK